MIVEVNENLENKFWEYISYEEGINLFILGDVENYGFNTKFQKVWIQLNEEKITSVILRYYTSLIIYSYKNNFNILELINHINSLEIDNISGKKEVIDRLLSVYTEFKIKKESDFCSLKKINNLDFSNIKHYKIEKAKLDDLEKIFKLLNSLEEFVMSDYIKAKTIQLKTDSGRIYIIRQDKEIIATVSTGIETSFLAMISDVFTHKKYRNKKLASYIVYTLSKELLSEGKTPCLFYSNEIAGKVYKNIGYKKDNTWSTLIK